MNTLLKFRHTPTGRTKMDRSEDVRIGTGANTRDDKSQWGFIQLHINGVDDKDTSYRVQLDRETAARVVAQFTKYLADEVKL